VSRKRSPPAQAAAVIITGTTRGLGPSLIGLVLSNAALFQIGSNADGNTLADFSLPNRGKGDSTLTLSDALYVRTSTSTIVTITRSVSTWVMNGATSPPRLPLLSRGPEARARRW
jgi:hypothetical protein